MTKPAPTKAEQQAARRKQYLMQFFAMHPMWQAQQMLELRNRALGLESAVQKKNASSSRSFAEMAQLRDRVREQIASVQQEFWSMPLDQLKRRLQGIPIKELPEFRPAVVRLRTTAAARGHFPSLAQSKSMDMKLFRAFKTAVVLPPAEAGFQREKFIQSIKDKKRLKKVRRAVEFIREENELLYNLEKDWFETILTMKLRKNTAAARQRSTFSFALPEFGWGTWFVVLTILRIVLRIMRMHD